MIEVKKDMLVLHSASYENGLVRWKAGYLSKEQVQNACIPVNNALLTRVL